MSRLVERVYTVLPPELAEWGREQGIEAPPQALALAESAKAQNTEKHSAPSHPPLALVRPDPQTIYRLNPTLPANEQRIAIEAQPGLQLTTVTLLADGLPLATLTHPPYRALWTLTPGEHSFRAVGRDASGKIIESTTVHVTVLK